MSEIPASLAVEYGPDDYLALTRQLRARWLKFYRIVAIAFAVLLLVFLASSTILNEPLDWYNIGILAAASCSLFLLSTGRFQALAMGWQARRNRLLAPQEFVALPDGLKVVSKHGDSLIYWTSLHSICETPDRLFLFVNRGCAYIIPRRAFDSVENFHSFVAMAKSGGTPER